MSPRGPNIAVGKGIKTCSPFCPPLSGPPVDNSQICTCPTRLAMRLSTCQAAKQPSEMDRKRIIEARKRSGQIPGLKVSEAQADGDGKTGLLLENKRHVRAKASPPMPSPGRIPIAVRQTDDPSGPSASRTPEDGKNCPSGKGHPKFGAVGADSNVSAHLFCA